MSAYTYPGVYIQELPSGINAITGVATSIAAFAGWASQGPTTQATLVQSWTDYTNQFGGLDARSLLGYAVKQFFANGGQQAYIVRLTQSAAITTGTATGVSAGQVQIAAGAANLILTAKSPGAWSNTYAIQITTITGQAAGTFNLNVVYAPSSSVLAILESFPNLVAATLAPANVSSSNVTLTITGTTATTLAGVPANGLYRLTGGSDGNGIGVPPSNTASVNITGLKFDPTTKPNSTVTVTTAATGGLTFTTVSPGIWGNNYSVQFQPRPDDYTRFTLALLYTDPTATTPTPTGIETYANLSLNPNDSQGRYVVNIISEQSNFLNASMAATPLTITLAGTVPSPPPPSGVGTVSLLGGNDGALLAPATKPGFPNAFETALNVPTITAGSPPTFSGTGGLQTLTTVPIFNLLCVPGEIDPATISSLQAFCVAERAFLIADCQSTDTFATLQSGPPSTIMGNNAINSAFYFPWVNAFDPLLSVTRAFPPCGFVAGLYAATDTSRGVWKAPAGIDASLTGEAGLTTVLTDAQNGTLNTQAINCLRNFRAYGDVVWGARTLRGSDQVGSQWKYVPIRRLALYIESSLYDGTQWVVFEPNDATLWGQIRLNIGSFMQGLFLEGAFQGTTPSQAYFVKCDAENNPQASIDLGIVNVLVGFAPLYPAEFVVIQIQQMAGQTQS
jgi:phage tail sheath protein FI